MLTLTRYVTYTNTDTRQYYKTYHVVTLELNNKNYEQKFKQ